MSHSHDHPVAGFLFLAFAFGLIGVGSKAGMDASREAQRRVAKEQVNKAIRAAVELGQRGEFEQAEEALRKIVKEHPSDPDALFNLGIAQLAVEKDDEADRTFELVLGVSPSDWDAVAERAGIKKRKGDVEGGLALLEKVPPGMGHLPERLAQDPLWADLGDNPRLRELRKRHGVAEGPTDTTLRDTAPEPGSTP